MPEFCRTTDSDQSLLGQSNYNRQDTVWQCLPRSNIVIKIWKTPGLFKYCMQRLNFKETFFLGNIRRDVDSEVPGM